MNELSPPCLRTEAFGGFETFHSPPPSYHSSHPFDTLHFDPNNASPYSTSTTPLASELQTPALKPPLCPLCKGQRYQFTAYFHNPKIFPSPPHHLLPLIEKSYTLNDRLKSLLVTYAMHDIEQDCLASIESEINAWAQEVRHFTTYVLCSAMGFEADVRPLEEVKAWTAEMARQMVEHVKGGARLEMPRGRMRVLLGEFRGLWEKAWAGYLRDQTDPGVQYSQDVVQSLHAEGLASDCEESDGQWAGQFVP